MTPAAAAEAIRTVALVVAVGIALIAGDDRLRLTAAGDEGRQTGHFRRDIVVLIVLIVLLRTRLVLLRLMLRIAVLRLIARRERLRIARQIRLRLRLRRSELRLLALTGERLCIVLAIVVIVVGGAGRRARRRRRIVVIGILLPELFLRRGDQAEIMFGVLEVVLGRDRIAGALRIARQLHVFLGDMRGGAANFHVGAVRLVDPRQRILALAVIVIVVATAATTAAAATAAATAHTLLTVSHDFPVRQLLLRYSAASKPPLHR